MDNFEVDGIVIPYINLNGNKKSDIMHQLSMTYNFVYHAKESFMKIEMYDGRNGANAEHRKALKDERAKYFSKLDEVHTYLGKVMLEIQEL